MTALNLSLLTANTPSTSGSYTFSVTRDDIIRTMMLDLGALGEGENPTPAEISDSARKLNMLAKQWMGNTDFAPGLKVWTRKRADLFLQTNQFVYQVGQTGIDHWVESTTGLTYPQSYGQTTLTANAAIAATVLQVASTSQFNILDYIGIQIGQGIFWSTITAIGVGTVTIPAPGLTAAALANAYVWNYTKKGIRPLTLITASLRDIYANDTDLRMIKTVETYEALPTKTAPTSVGDPTAVFYESHFKNQAPNGRLYLDVGCPQDVTKHLHCVYLSPVEDFVNPGDAPDYPQQWYRPLVLGLGRECAGMLDCAWTPELEANLQDSLAIARQADPENTDVFFQVDGDGYDP